MKNKPRVGIFMPAYNQGPYINEAIASLKKQTFQDFEVAIVDDASSDNKTIDILKNINYSKAKIYFAKKNRGVGKLARIHYKKLQTEYIFVLCADDMIDPTYIEKCVGYLDKHTDVAAVATWIQCFGANNSLIKLDMQKASLPHALVESHFLGSAMMRRSALEQIDFGLDRRRQNDYDRWVSMMDNGWKLGVIEEPLFHYRQLNHSLSHTINIDEEIEFRKFFIERHRNLFDEHYEYVLLELYRQIFEMRNWQNELTEGRDWLAEQYDILKEENSKLVQSLKQKEDEIARCKKVIKYGISVYLPLKKIQSLRKKKS